MFTVFQICSLCVSLKEFGQEVQQTLFQSKKAQNTIGAHRRIVCSFPVIFSFPPHAKKLFFLCDNLNFREVEDT